MEAGRVGCEQTFTKSEWCNDDFTESIDMASVLHAQTILATKYAGEPITDPFGYPLRLRTADKLGYKNPKWIKAIKSPTRFAARSGAGRAKTGSRGFDGAALYQRALLPLSSGHFIAPH
jgi:DMSO/TMAO reductase YedYZ molybdopterin-dependent catalytic subunit